jgi:hypothetical protein
MFRPAGQWPSPEADMESGFSNGKSRAKKNILGNRQSLFKGEYKKFGLLKKSESQPKFED